MVNCFIFGLKVKSSLIRFYIYVLGKLMLVWIIYVYIKNVGREKCYCYSGLFNVY